MSSDINLATTLGRPEWTNLAGRDLSITNDASIGLGAARVDDAITRGTIDN